MKKDNWEEVYAKYWKGSSSLDDERKLKQSDDVYFRKLGEAAKEQMDWSFEEFLEGLDKKSNPSAIGRSSWINRRRLWKMSAVAALVLLLGGWGFWLMWHQPDSAPVEQKIALKQDSAISPELGAASRKDADPLEQDAASEQLEDTSRKLAGAIDDAERAENTLASQGEPAHKTLADDSAQSEAYVLVNGQAIYDPAEAEQIALSSVRLVAENFHKGQQALSRIKEMKIAL